MEQKVMHDKRKFIKVIFLFMISSIILFFGIRSLYRIEKYPQRMIQKEDLYGENGNNLKDFHIDRDGNIVSTSDDPWATFQLSDTINIKEVDITVDSVSKENSWAQIFFILQDGTWEYEEFYLHSGVNQIKVNGKKGFRKVQTIRFDLTSDPGIVINLNEIQLNFFYHPEENYSFLGLLICLSLILFLFLLKRKEIQTVDEDQDIFAGITIAFASSFLLCVFAPLDLYFNNWNEFWFDVYQLLPLVLIMFIAAVLIGIVFFLLLFFIFKKVYKLSVVFGVVIFIGCYLQGNYFVRNLPPLDGTKFNWADYPAGKFESALLWYIVAAVGILLFKILKSQTFYRFVKYTSSFIIAVTMVTLCIECVTTYGYQNKLNASVTTKNQFEMSEDKNFIILVLDALDSGTFQEVMNENPDYEEIFEDFTYYPNTMGTYSFTSRAIPYILSGKWFENQELFVKYNENAYKSTGLFAELEKEDYKLGVYETTMPNTDRSIFRFDNVYESKASIKSYSAFALLECKLVWFKYAPFHLKSICKIDTKDFNIEKEDDQEHLSLFQGGNIQFYEDIQKEDVTYTKQKCFRFIHIEGAHVPFRYDKDVNYIENGTYEQNIEASVTITKAYLEKLKSCGVYDNSVIIVMSDHGYKWIDGHSYGRQNPLFMIKGIGEKHTMDITNAPISYEDLQAAYKKLLDGENGRSVFEWKEGDQRERRYLWYKFLEEDHMVEYMQTGEAADPDSMYPTGQEFNR